MGLRFRRSINLAGGFRINIGKSGIGYSWGTTGFRVGRTSRGTTRTTFSIPGTGISYSWESGRSNDRDLPPREPNQSQQNERNNRQYDINRDSDNTDEFLSDDAVGTNNIVSSIKRAISLDFWGTILIGSIVLMAFNTAFIVLPLAGIAMKIIARTLAVVELEYSFDAEMDEEHNRRIDAWTILAEGDKEWQIVPEQATNDSKTNKFENDSKNRFLCVIEKNCPYYIKTNVDTMEIKLKKETLIILPDKVFVIRGRQVSLVDYKNFNISVSSINFRENEKVPSDAHIVGNSWKFVNPNGTPDRQHQDNPQIPVCLYGIVHLYSANRDELDVRLMVSNIQKAKDFRDLVE